MAVQTVPQHVTEAAEYWRENNAKLFQARRVVLDWVNEHGPIPLADGKLLGHKSNGNDWDHDGIAQVMPQLVTAAKVTFEGPAEKVERLLSLAVEEVPDLDYTVKRTVSLPAANAVIKAGGAAAELIKSYKTEATKLGVI